MSLKGNFVYSTIITISNYLFPMIVFPYVSRTLGLENVGICNFIDSIVTYFVFFSMMGIMTMGIREVAASREDRQRRSIVFSTLLVLNGLFTLLAIIGLGFFTFYVDAVADYRNMMYIGMFKLACNFLLIEWFYQGLEEFKYITQRTLIVKTCYILSIFLLVKDRGDYELYYLLTTLMVTFNALVNIVYSRKYVSFSFRHLQLGKCFRPYITLGWYMILSNMYTSFNITYIGFVASKAEVGDFSTATKLFTLFIMPYTSLSRVVMPRMSTLSSLGEKEKMRELIGKSFSCLLTFSVPLFLVFCCFSSDIVVLILGDEFVGVAQPMRIIAPLFLIVCYEQILVMQILIPVKADNAILTISSIGAGVGIGLNLALVPILLKVGSSVAWVVSELCVLLAAQYFVGKRDIWKFPVSQFFKYVLTYLPVALICICTHAKLALPLVPKLLIEFFLLAIAYLTIEIIVFKNTILLSLRHTICQRLKSFKS
ncbi:MAG: flippase [Bacteroidaceae bacterium]|nr:flippase [Bacteroidaceae bacterium]